MSHLTSDQVATTGSPLSEQQRMAFLYAIGHGTTIAEACKYAQMTPAALVAEYDSALATLQDADSATAEFMRTIPTAIDSGLHQRRIGVQPRAEDLGQHMHRDHTHYVHPLRQTLDAEASAELDEYYLEN